MSERQIGPFQVGEQLGVGGMGIVYRAVYTKTGQDVALKVLSPNLTTDKKLLARFDRETKILKRLKHPNIVRYYGGGTNAGQRYYAMELIDGGALDDYVKKRGGTLTWEQVIEVGKQICSALEHAHNAGIIHRDLKPANLFLTRKGRLKLGDFGIARDTEATALTAAGKTVGTYAYMAPEQIVGKPEISRKTDLYALACVLFELLTGKPPFEAETAAEMLFAHLETDPPSVRDKCPECPIWLEQLIERMLEKDPDDRPYDALAVHTELSEIPAKVAEQRSIAAETMSGSVTASSDAKQELAKLLGKKKKKRKKKKQEPIYERTWFLVTCLVLIVGFITWMAWPLSEDEIYARAENAMKSNEVLVREDAHDKYILAYLEDFPDGRYLEQMQAWDDEIRVDRLERQLEVQIARNREAENEAERLYMDARKYHKIDDRLTALRKYRDVVNLLQNNAEQHLYVKLAERQIEAIESEGSETGDRFEFVNSNLRRAEELAKNGKVVEAEEIWRIIEQTYGDNREFTLQVQYARARLNGEPPPDLDLEPESSE